MKIKDKKQLREIINSSPIDADLNYLDVSEITDMSWLFSGSNGDISKWDVSSVEDMTVTLNSEYFNIIL